MPDNDGVRTFTFLGLQIPLTKANVSLLGLVIVVGVAAFLYQKIWNQPEQQILNLKTLVVQRDVEARELLIHMMEDPIGHLTLDDPSGGLTLRVYADDCVVIMRRTKEPRAKLVMDLAREKGRLTELLPTIPSFTAMLYAETLEAACTGRGMFHPNVRFRQWAGEPLGNGWVRLYTQWPDGCTFWQPYHPQSGQMAVNPDGSPKVFWVCGVH